MVLHGGMAKVWLTTYTFASVGIKIRADHIDNVITAEISNKDEDPVLYDTVKRYMIHGSCGALNLNSPCVNNQKVKKMSKGISESNVFR